jgi:methyl-accepting chemotaxis protein
MLAKIVEFQAKSNNVPVGIDTSITTVMSFLNRVSNVPDQTQDFKKATALIFAEVCAFTNWPIGHLYLKSTENPDDYVSNDVWYLEPGLDQAAIEEFQRISEDTVFQVGKGLIGQIAETKEAKAVEDVTVLKQFLRAASAKQSGVRGFFGFPIIVKGECVAVAEFYGREKGLLNETYLEIMTYVSSQLARLYEREKTSALQKQLVAQFLSSVQASVNNLAAGSQALDVAGQGVQSQAQINNQQCHKVAGGCESIATNMDTLHAAMERLISVEGQTIDANSNVNSTVEDLGEKVTSALSELRRLSQLATNIEGVARNVSEISGQVRMLGLNASIEAARAGAAGKGFAIVAGEIKSLAQQSEQSSQDISTQLGEVMKIAGSSANLMNAVEQSMTDLETCTMQLSEVVEVQHEATDTINNSINSVQGTFGEMNDDIDTMNGVSADLLNLSENVSEQVVSINELSVIISEASDDFIQALAKE